MTGWKPIPHQITKGWKPIPLQVLAAADVDFNRDIRPILAAKCLSCHGPDDGTRKADLRLDAPSDAIVPGDPLQSPLYLRLTSDDPEQRMPPPEATKTVSSQEIEWIRRWIETGAKYEPHWALVPPQRASLPQVRDRSWPRNPIDHFVLARLEALTWSPAPPADPHTLARRVHIDLIGLPPRPDQLRDFLDDAQRTSIDIAYERLVDRLLASPHYGERWARRWLDLARYADTNGYEKDQPRTMWPYRDWVVDALNHDMPFDRFTIEQIAGDLLPDATESQRIATGFHRNTMLNEEGGIDPLEYRFYAMTDRVATTGTTWLGLTLGCAQCHTHKYDPVTQREYYQFMAFLNNCDEPDMDLTSAAKDRQDDQNRREADQLLVDLPNHWPGKATESGPAIGWEAYVDQWISEQQERMNDWTVLRSLAATSNMPLLTIEADGSVIASGDITKSDTYVVTFPATAAPITAIRLEALPDSRLPAHGPGLTYYEGTKGDFFLGEFTLAADSRPQRIARASHSYAQNRYGQPVSAALTIDGDPQTGWSVDGRIGERHLAVYVLEAPLPPQQPFEVTMRFGRHFASSLGRFRLSVTSDSPVGDPQDLPAELEDLLRQSSDTYTNVQLTQLRQEALLRAPLLAEQAARIRQLRRGTERPFAMVLRERPAHNQRRTYIHQRGEFLRPTDEVEPAFPAMISAADQGPRDRLALAQWLVSPENPLTARVTVNRHWATFMGQGIVRTLEDFGVQGAPPTHPELLDWLASEFMASGWSVKRLHRLIVTSATYRQSSRVDATKWAADPRNDWLSRAARPRFEAEVIRDVILQASGLLVANMRGPGVRPPQPEGVTESAYGGAPWVADRGADRYRRSLYTFRKRTAPFAMYDTFDGPSGESCLARREVSNSPLQALTLLNDGMFMEAAQVLGPALARSHDTDQERVHQAFLAILSRPATADEQRELDVFIAKQRQRISSGELPSDALGGPMSLHEDAVWTAVVRALFGLDETITRN